MQSEDIYNCLKKNAAKAFDRTPVLFACLFGSYADGTAHVFSDLDIAIYIEPEHLDSAYRIEMELGLELDSLLDREVSTDVRTLNTLPIEVVGEVMKFGRLIYSSDENIRVDFEVLARKRYFDFKPVIDNYRRLLLKAWNRK